MEDYSLAELLRLVAGTVSAADAVIGALPATSAPRPTREKPTARTDGPRRDGNGVGGGGENDPLKRYLREIARLRRIKS